MAEYTPKLALQGGPFTSQASATIVGGQFVGVSGVNTVGPAAAGSLVVVGVAAHDAATGAKLAVFPLKMIHESVAGVGGITAGNPIKVGATADVAVLWVTGTDSAAAFLGIALNTAIATATFRWIGR